MTAYGIFPFVVTVVVSSPLVRGYFQVGRMMYLSVFSWGVAVGPCLHSIAPACELKAASAQIIVFPL